MKKIGVLQKSMIVLACSAGMHSAFAADGTITFTGKVGAQTCTINGGGASSKNFTVALPVSISTNTLSAKGNTAGRTGFQIALTNCTPATGNVHTFFESGPLVDISTGNLKPMDGGAANVQIALLNDDATKIKLGADDASQNSKPVPIDKSGAATLSYFAEYVSTGAAGPGDVNSSVMYSLVYQ